MTHLHLTAIVLTIIFFLITFFMQKAGRNTKVIHMILRIMYIILLVSGGMLFFSVFNITFLYILKAVLGILMIAFFEIILRKRRGWKSYWSSMGINCFNLYFGHIHRTDFTNGILYWLKNKKGKTSFRCLTLFVLATIKLNGLT